MSNIIKYSGGTTPNSIKSGNFNVGVNNTSTDLTGFFNGISPINGGYTIYIDKASGGPSIYSPKNDSELVSIVQKLGGNVSTAADALVWINSQSNMTVLNNNYPSIVTDGLVLNLDAGFVSSYPKTGTTWRDLSGNGNNGSLINGVSYNSSNNGNLVFDGTNDRVQLTNNITLSQTSDWTLQVWVKSNQTLTGSSYLRLLNLGTGGGSNFFIFEWNNRILAINSSGTGFAFQTGFTPGLPLDNSTFLLTMIGRNGVLEVYSNLIQTTVNVALSGNLTFNSLMNGNGSFFPGGNINMFSCYNRALTLQEITQNYYAGLQRFIPTDGLVLSLDAQNTNLYATSATTAYDVSGNGNNGTLTNGTQYVSDGDGSWSFDGINDYVSTAITTFGNNTTWTVWINRVSSVNTFNMFMGRFLPYFAAREGTNGFLFSNSINSVQKSVYSIGVTVKDNTWYHLSFTTEYNGVDTTMKMYINGVLNNSGTFTGEQTQFGYAFSIGDGRNLPWYPFNGEVNDVRIYNRVLTQAEITTIYNATKSRYGIQ